MVTEPIATEIVWQVSEEKQYQILKEHFNLLFLILVENRLVPNAVFEMVKGGISHCLSGLPLPYHNAVLGCPAQCNWDECIDEQLSYFYSAKMPFVWYLDEETNVEFKQKLIDHGFQDGGIFQGHISFLDRPIPSPVVPNECLLELVNSEAAMDEFNEVICSVFGIQGESKELFKKVLWNATKMHPYTMFHWVARKQGKVVSVLSTLIQGDTVSLWNGATVPEHRRQGLCTALSCFALTHANSKGCRIATAYLMPDGMFLGISKKLGFQSKWQFNGFLAHEDC